MRSWKKPRFAWLAAPAFLFAASTGRTVELPQSVPVPMVYPPPAGNLPPQKLGDTPIPEKRPEPEERPDGKDEPVQPPERQPRYQPDPRTGMTPAATMPAEERDCRADLKALGVTFEEKKAELGEGCALPYPVSVSALSRNIALDPPAELNCAMARAVAKFSVDTIAPAALAAYGHELRAIGQASAFVCRPRHGTAKLSEHAFGNALDLAGFSLDGGMTIGVTPAPDAKAGPFLAAIRKAACGPFKTVLGPGSDADHALHLHFDLEPRRHGGTFCQ